MYTEQILGRFDEFLGQADGEAVEQLFQGIGGAKGDAFFPAIIPVAEKSNLFRIRSGLGGTPSSLCFSKVVFVGRVGNEPGLVDLASYASCSQSSDHLNRKGAVLGVEGAAFSNNVHTLREADAWWQAEFPDVVQVRFVFFYRRFDRFIKDDKHVRLVSVSEDGAETILYYPQGREHNGAYLSGIVADAVAALEDLRCELKDKAEEQQKFDDLVTTGLAGLDKVLEAFQAGDKDVLKNFSQARAVDISDALLEAMYIAAGDVKDFGLSPEEGCEVSFDRTKVQEVRLRAFGELPPGMGGGEFFDTQKSTAEPALVLSRADTVFKFNRPPFAVPSAFGFGLTTRIQARMIKLDKAVEVDRFCVWNINRQHAANTVFLEVSVRGGEDEDWQVILDQGKAYRRCCTILRLVNLLVGSNWTPHYGRLIGKLFTMYRRRALMRPVARFTRSVKEVHDAVFEGSDSISLRTKFASPLRLGKHGLGVPIAYRDPKVVMGHLTEMRDKIRALGYKPMFMYGTLLGAIREKDWIAHDDDVDLAVILEGVGPDELNDRTEAFIKMLNENGVKANRGSIYSPLIHCHRGPITYDIFILGQVDDKVYWPHKALKVVPERADIFLPRKEIEFKGEMFDAPNDPEAVCEARYGADWHIPNPAFEW